MKNYIFFIMVCMLLTGCGSMHSKAGKWWYNQGDKYNTGEITSPKG